MYLPPDFGSNSVERYTWIQRDELHLTLLIRKIEERFVSDDKLRPLASYAQLPCRCTSLQMPGSGEKVEALNKGPLFELHDDKDTLRVNGNLAGTTTAR